MRELLAGYFGASLKVYDSYAARPIQPSVANYVKTHDFSFNGTTVLTDIFPEPRHYLVQVRHPLESIASLYEFALHHGMIRIDSFLTWRLFLRLQLRRWRRFVDLWVRGRTKHALVMPYSRLLDEPEQALVEVITLISGSDEVCQKSVRSSLAKVEHLQYVGETKSFRGTRRQLAEFRYFDAALFRRIEEKHMRRYLLVAGIDRFEN